MPLTYHSSDNDLETVTPNCFLKADPNGNVILRFDEDPIWDRDPTSRDTLIDALSSRDELLSHSKELWYDKYLLSLRETCRDLHQVNWNYKISIDNIVLVKLLNKSRPYWVLGHVLELIRGHDDEVRSVKLKRGDGAVAHHSINHSYPLELSLTHNPHFENNDSTQIESNIIPRDIVPDVSSGDDSVNRNQTASGDDSLNQSQAASGDSSFSRPSDSVDGRRMLCAAAIVSRERVQSWARKLNLP